jgi:hypothetical protein
VKRCDGDWGAQATCDIDEELFWIVRYPTCDTRVAGSQVPLRIRDVDAMEPRKDERSCENGDALVEIPIDKDLNDPLVVFKVDDGDISDGDPCMLRW